MLDVNKNISLPELVMIQMGCKDGNELGSLDKWQRRYLAELLAGLDPTRPCLCEWNRLLTLTLAIPAECSCAAARTKLLTGLRAG